MPIRDPRAGPELAPFLGLATDLAIEAGAVLLEAHGAGDHRRELARAATRKSSETDLASEADRASEMLITSRLAALRPDDAILAEEGGARSGTSGLTWIIDPLDGTTNFLYGYSPFCVSIAVADHDGVVLAGVVHDPVHAETFTAMAGGGGLLNGQPLACPDPPAPLAESLIGTGFGYTATRRSEQSALLPTVLPAVRDIRRGGSAALDLCFVAAGRLDGFYEGGLQPWDRAAGLLVATEAGATFAEIEGVIEGAALLVVAPEPLATDLGALLVEADRRARPADLPTGQLLPLDRSRKVGCQFPVAWNNRWTPRANQDQIDIEVGRPRPAART